MSITEPMPFIRCAICKVETNDEHVMHHKGRICRRCAIIEDRAPKNSDSLSFKPLYQWQK